MISFIILDKPWCRSKHIGDLFALVISQTNPRTNAGILEFDKYKKNSSPFQSGTLSGSLSCIKVVLDDDGFSYFY